MGYPLSPGDAAKAIDTSRAPSEYEQLRQRLGDELSLLMDEIGQLEAGLDRVLLPGGEATSTVNAPPVEVPPQWGIGADLRKCTEVTIEAKQRVRMMRNRLAI